MTSNRVDARFGGKSFVAFLPWMVEGKRREWEGAGGGEKLLGPDMVLSPSRIAFPND